MKKRGGVSMTLEYNNILAAVGFRLKSGHGSSVFDILKPSMIRTCQIWGNTKIRSIRNISPSCILKKDGKLPTWHMKSASVRQQFGNGREITGKNRIDWPIRQVNRGSPFQKWRRSCERRKTG